MILNLHHADHCPGGQAINGVPTADLFRPGQVGMVIPVSFVNDDVVLTVCGGSQVGLTGRRFGGWPCAGPVVLGTDATTDGCPAAGDRVLRAPEPGGRHHAVNSSTPTGISGPGKRYRTELGGCSPAAPADTDLPDAPFHLVDRAEVQHG